MAKREITALVRAAKSAASALKKSYESRALTTATVKVARDEFHSRELDVTFGRIWDSYHLLTSRIAPSITDGDSTALMKSSSAIIAANLGALELERRRLGLDVVRQRLIDEIYKNISFDNGVEKILTALNLNPTVLARYGLTKAVGLEDIAQCMPSITSQEIAWISTLEHVPAIYVADSDRVPTIADFSVEGIEFCFDGIESIDMIKVNPNDSYAASGMTGARKGSSRVPFTPTFKAAFRSLMLLLVEDSHLYNSLRELYEQEFLIRGDQKLKRILLANKMNGSSKRLEDLLSDGTISEHDIQWTFTEATRKLSNKVLVDLGYLDNNELCSVSDVITVVGMLQKIPECLVQDEPFAGYILPFGYGVKIIDSGGQDVGYYEFNAFSKQRVTQDFFYTQKDISRTNRIASIVFSNLAAVLDITVPYQDTLAHDMIRRLYKEELGISIESYSSKTINETPEVLYELLGAKADKESASYTLKAGVFELETLFEVLKKIPKNLRPEISRIVKEFRPGSYDQLVLGGMDPIGEYHPGTKTVVLRTPETGRVGPDSSIQLQQLRNTLAHEIGHGVYKCVLTDEQVNIWSAISGADRSFNDAEQQDRFVYNIHTFLDGYRLETLEGTISEPSDTLKIEEDFCETFSIYLNHGTEFFVQAKTRSGVREKYEFLKEVFETAAKESEEVEFHELNPYSISEMYVQTDVMRKRYSLDQKLELANQLWTKEERKSLVNREDVCTSLDALEIDNDRDYIYQFRGITRSLLDTVNENTPTTFNIRTIQPDTLVSLALESPKKAAAYVKKLCTHVDSATLVSGFKGDVAALDSGYFRDDHTEYREDELDFTTEDIEYRD